MYENARVRKMSVFDFFRAWWMKVIIRIVNEAFFRFFLSSYLRLSPSFERLPKSERLRLCRGERSNGRRCCKCSLRWPAWLLFPFSAPMKRAVKNKSSARARKEGWKKADPKVSLGSFSVRRRPKLSVILCNFQSSESESSVPSSSIESANFYYY